ncbi:IgaA: a membrane protein that prevents overactivation of the Rcs regulatory system [Citrobacter freundii]|uniref:IgaA: a membrane protein that prevents overactivation of the Rcs regulatory system n=1 Tax=Citrobacter freundii TaxID=546 RepID=A0A7G2IZS3_CITFR|nr:IgaA: a membrane protein that prevents overactivation of the Rcs regulatory system [Citrobacter freundii]
MSTILIFLAALLACSLLAGWLLKSKSRQKKFTLEQRLLRRLET